MACKPKPAPIYDKNKNSYRLHFCHNGKQHRRYYISNQHTAYCLQNDINHLVSKYKNGLAAPAPGITLADFIFNSVVRRPESEAEAEAANDVTITALAELIVEYRRMSAPPANAPSTYRTETIHLQHLQEFVQAENLPNLLLEEINVGFFNHYKKYRYAQGVRTDTVNKELGTLQVLFQMAVEHGYLQQNVVKEVKRDKSDAPTDRYKTLAEIRDLSKSGNYKAKEIQEMMKLCYLDAEEVEALIAIAQDHWLYPVLRTFAETGIRKGELTKLLWSDVDFEHNVVWVASQKQSRTLREKKRAIPINKDLRPVLLQQKLQTGNGRWVFQGPVPGKQIPLKTLGNAFHRLVEGTS